MKLLLLALIVCSCAGFSGKPKEGKMSYTYQDVSGTFRLNRESKMVKQKLIGRSQLLAAPSNKLLEKSITVAQLGSIKDGKHRSVTLKPMASEFTVWLEGKKYFSRMQLNPQKKSMSVTMESPDEKWNGTKEVPFPQGKHFCFFSQLPECLYHNLFLQNASEGKRQSHAFWIIWDSFPYTQEEYTGVGSALFSSSTVKFDGMDKAFMRFIVETEGQIIIYHFSKSYDFVKMSWIAQGITIVPPGEEVDED